MLCTCSREQYRFEEALATPPDGQVTKDESQVSGLSSKINEGEAKPDDGSIEEAETSLREAFTLNNEEARALLGRLEYQRGNFEGALQVFDGIDIGVLVPRLRYFASDRARNRRYRSRIESAVTACLHTASLLFEAKYLKAKCLQKLGRPVEAAEECRHVMAVYEAALPQGLPSSWTGDNKLSETVGKAAELLPKTLIEAGQVQEAIAAYRRALLGSFSLDSENSARIHKEFAVLLLYGGVEASAPSLASHSEGAFVPKNNLEESILLFLLLLRQSTLRTIPWDPTIIEHLSFALSVCGQSEFLAQQYEMLLPGTQSRAERWYNLALCYSGASQSDVALNLLRKSLNPVEKPDDVPSLLLAAKLCAKDVKLSSEGVGYAERAVENAKGGFEYMKGAALHVLGVVLGLKVKASLSDSERTKLQAQALSALQAAASIEKEDPKVIFDLALEYAEQRNLTLALDCAKKFIDLSGGASAQGWKLLALILSAQQRFGDAEAALDAALDDTGKWEQGELLRLKAKIQMAQGQSMRAVETYRLLLALVQAQRKSFEAGSWRHKVGESVEQVEVWQGLATVYTSLEQWRDAEICLEKAQGLRGSSAVTWHGAGALHEARGNVQDALAAYNNALAVDPDHVPSKVSTGSLLRQRGGNSLPVARSFLTDALRSEPTNHLAWYNLGMLHKVEGRAREAADCFQAAFLLEQSAPVERFSSVLPALFW
ncbi:hypothetical protein R1sor_014861 [Riccia sorocarpa]|uniref:Uncharacterized protein n=1 Tax=Riccia sorocarpa TaxID=122646 RepID=A0ABD3HD80_9MARC